MKVLNKLGYTKVEVLVVIVLLGLVTFITISSTSSVFASDNNEDVKAVFNLIENQAVEYAQDHLDIFKEMNTTFITVGDLIQEGYYYGNDDGLVVNPNNVKENYNDNKIKLEYDKDKGKVKATLII